MKNFFCNSKHSPFRGLRDIKIAYRQIIDASSQTNFERNVFNASYNEFLLKSQAYNPEKKFKTFTELKANDGRANSLHYKSSFAVVSFINNLNNQIPNLQDTLGQNIRFETYKFEVIESSITDKTVHKVAIIYFTDTLTLFEIIGDYILLGVDKLNNVSDEPVETFLLKMHPNLSIVNYQLFKKLASAESAVTL